MEYEILKKGHHAWYLNGITNLSPIGNQLADNQEKEVF